MAGGRHAGPPGQGGRVRLPPHVARLVLLVSAVVGVDTIFYAALAPLLPYYQHSAGLTEAGAGVLVAAYAAGTLVGALPSGALVARVGARPGLLVGLALMSVSSVVFGFASSIAWLLIAARFVQGIGGAASWAAGLAWLAAAAPAERRGELLGTAFGAAVAGALLGPVVGAVADQIGTAWTFCAAAVLGAALAAWSLLVGSSEQEPQRLREALPALRARGVRLGLLLIVVSGVAYGVVEVLAPLQLDAAGATALFISATFLLAAVLATVASPLVGRLSDVRGAAWPTRLSLAGIIGLSVLAAFVTPLWSLAVIFVLGLPVLRRAHGADDGGGLRWSAGGWAAPGARLRPGELRLGRWDDGRGGRQRGDGGGSGGLGALSLPGRGLPVVVGCGRAAQCRSRTSPVRLAVLHKLRPPIRIADVRGLPVMCQTRAHDDVSPGPLPGRPPARRPAARCQRGLSPLPLILSTQVSIHPSSG